MIPVVTFADETPPEEQTQEQNNATSSDQAIVDDTASSTDDGTASSTDSGTNGGNATSTDDGTDGGDGTSDDDGNDGDDGAGNTENGQTATTTATSTPETEPGEGTPGDGGGSGDDGPDGNEGSGGTAGATPDDEINPIDIVSDELLGDPDGEETTGDVVISAGANSEIITGIATAQGELSTDANSNDIRSELESFEPQDYDTYTFTATGTNDAQVSNDGLARAVSGDNYIEGRGTATIHTGDAVAAFNIANVINTNVINSDGFIYLANNILEEGASLDLTATFFPDVAELEYLSGTCSLLSCVAEDVIYNVSQTNHATITNSALIEATTGYNETAEKGTHRFVESEVVTGDAYATANVLNVVNSNIIDSNYRLLTYNAIGDLDGDLVLPTGELFDEFFSRPNGTNQVEDAEDFHVNVNNVNDAIVDNAVEANAVTGENESTTDFDALISTGRSESESNVLNKINENTYGGDSLYMLIRIHGWWDGEVVGLPEGLTWDWTPEGVIIYNVDAEIEPSEFLGYDQDSYTGNFSNNNRVALENNIELNAVTGENQIEGITGVIQTGNAFASANVMNIANTNVIGTNWTMAIINILGDFEGNISFAATDIGLEGEVVAPNPIGPGDTLSYTYTITNHSNTTTSNIWLDQVLENAHTNTNATTQSSFVGTLEPGESTQVSFSAMVDDDIAYGTTSVTAYASVSGDQGDVNNSDNLSLLSVIATHDDPNPDDTGTTTDTDTGTGTTTDDTASTTDQTTDPDPYSQPSYYGQGSYSSGGGGGGGGGGGSSNKKSETEVERETVEADPNAPPLVTITKRANSKKGEIIEAGESVDYTITVTNEGGNAYNAMVYDTLTNPIDAVLDEQSWDLGTILPGEKIKLTYTTQYNELTPSGEYTNTASIVAYATENAKKDGEKPLAIKDAVYIVEIEGVDLAVGNIGVLAVFPGANNTVSALVAWETSKSSLGKVYYGPKTAWSNFIETATNYGFPQVSFQFSKPKVHHLMIIHDLTPGATYAYRIDAHTNEYDGLSREHTFTVPGLVQSLAINAGGSFLSAQALLSRVAGASASAPTTPVTPAPYSYTPPPPPKPPAPAPAPEPTPEPEPEQEVGLVGKVKNTLFGLFR